MAEPNGAFITEIDGVKFYTDRVVKGDLTFSARVGVFEVSTTYDVYSGTWTDGSAIKAPIGPVSIGIDDQGNLIGEAGYSFGQIAIVKTPNGEYTFVGGVGFDAGLLGGIQLSTTLSDSAYANNLSTYNTARINEDGTVSVTKFVSSSQGVFAEIYTYDKKGNLIDKQKVQVAPDKAAEMAAGLAPHTWDARCFSSNTLVQTSLTSFAPISDICIGDVVLAFDPCTELGRGGLVARRVSKLFRNTTTEWVKLNWSEDGETRELVMTPGHHVLDQYGQFPSIEAMLRDGKATVVLASGELAEVAASRIVYSEATAHLFEQATTLTASHAATIRGSTALAPQHLQSTVK
jgi:hypothetical protein